MVNLKIIGILLLFIGGVVFGFFLGLIVFHPEFPVAPSDYLTPNQIHIYPDRVEINITNASWSSYANSGSMIPVLDGNSNGIRIIPKKNEIVLGDLITYSKNVSCGKNCTKEEFIIHRVVQIGSDEKGEFYILRGDANPISDRKVRFEDIRWKTVIILY